MINMKFIPYFSGSNFAMLRALVSKQPDRLTLNGVTASNLAVNPWHIQHKVLHEFNVGAVFYKSGSSIWSPM